MPSYAVVVNDCAAPALVGLTHVRTRQTPYGSRTFEFDYERLVQGLPSVLTEVQQDWADVLTFIYAIDLACERGNDVDWQRDIRAWFPVRNPSFWRPIAPEIARVFGSLTYDHIEIEFVQDSAPLPTPRQSRTPLPAASGVALLSGGVDSFVGAASLLNKKETPLLLSHKNSGAAGTAIAAIAPTLRNRGAVSDPLTVTARRRSGSGEGSQRSRTMLYMGLACLVASIHANGQVWLNENGVMAIHVPLTEARAGSFSTRTASPSVVARFSRLASSTLGTNIAITNDLITMTKPEVTSLGKELGLSAQLKETVSCWSIGRSTIHCGMCTPCLVRRVGFEWAQLGDAPYQTAPFDVMPGGSKKPAAVDNLSHMAQLAVDLRDEDDESLLLEYSELLDVGLGLTVEESIKMHRRWADQFLTVAGGHTESAKWI